MTSFILWKHVNYGYINPQMKARVIVNANQKLSEANRRCTSRSRTGTSQRSCTQLHELTRVCSSFFVLLLSVGENEKLVDFHPLYAT